MSAPSTRSSYSFKTTCTAIPAATPADAGDCLLVRLDNVLSRLPCLIVFLRPAFQTCFFLGAVDAPFLQYFVFCSHGPVAYSTRGWLKRGQWGRRRLSPRSRPLLAKKLSTSGGAVIILLTFMEEKTQVAAAALLDTWSAHAWDNGL